MPIVTDKTERYVVKAMVPENGEIVYREWKVASIDRMPSLHPSFAELNKNYFRHRVKYRRADGTLVGRSRKPRDLRPIHIERINWIQDDEKRVKKTRAYRFGLAA